MKMEAETRPRVLCVDDEANVLEGLRRHLRRRFEVALAVGGAEGLEVLEGEGPFAVVISDLRMPGMDGVAFLGRVRQRAPDTSRVLLSGKADLEAAMAAVNEGHIFRFLTKPCPPPVLLKAVEAAAEQHRLVTAERVLLEQTLKGAVRTLTDVLSLANPTAFGRATRVKQQALEIASQLGMEETWKLEVAAMLSQLGCIALPPETLERLYRGEPLNPREQEMADRVPALTQTLLERIPRLEPVLEILRFQRKGFDGSGPPPERVVGEEIPLGARILHVALDYDALESRGLPPQVALETLRGREGTYDPNVLDAFARAMGAAEGTLRVREVAASDIQSGMVLAEDVVSESGVLLVARGQEVTPGLVARIQNFAEQVGVKEPLRVIQPLDPTPNA